MSRATDEDEDDDEAAEGIRPFTRALWTHILERQLGGTTQFDWLDLPAAGKLSVSTPRTLEPFDH